VRVTLAGHVALGGDADLEPGGQAFDVRGEDVLGSHRDAHREDGSHEDRIRRLAARAVDCGGLESEVVDYLFGHGSSLRYILTTPIDRDLFASSRGLF